MKGEHMARRKRKAKGDYVAFVAAPAEVGPEAPPEVAADMLARVNALADSGAIDGAMASKVAEYLAKPNARNVVLAAMALHGYPWQPGEEGTAQNLSYRLHDLSMELDPINRPPGMAEPRRRRRRGEDLTES